MARFQNGLNNQNLTIAKKQSIIEQLTETLDFNDLVFDLEHINTDLAEVRVTINAIELRKRLFNRVEISSDYTTQENDRYIAVDTTDRVTITLHTGFEGEKIIIKDETGNSNARAITVVRSGSDLIDDQISVIMKLNYIALQFIYTNNQWRIV